jgi:hypothetical protein
MDDVSILSIDLAPVKMSPRVQLGVTSSINRTKSSESSTYLEKSVFGIRIPFDLSWTNMMMNRHNAEEKQENAQKRERNACLRFGHESERGESASEEKKEEESE